jgi:HK97 family phage portal protein
MNIFGSSSASGITVTEAKALALSAVWACIDIKSDVFASFPYKVYRRTATGREQATDHPLYSLLSLEPNPMMSAFDYRKAIAVQLLKEGNCLVIPKRDGQFNITELFLVPTFREVTVTEHEGDLHYYYKGQHYFSYEVLHYKWFSLDGRIGVNPIAYHKETLGLGIAALLFGSEVLGNGSIQPAVLETDTELTGPQANELATSFASSYSGLGTGKKKVPVMHSGLKYKNIALDPDKAQFLGTKEHVIEEVCRIFNMPPSIIHHHLHSTMTNAEQQDLSFLKYSMGPFIARIENEDKRKLLTEKEKLEDSLYFKHNVEALLRADYEKRIDGLMKQVHGGVMDRNEAREKEDLNSRVGLDEMLVNANSIPESKLLAFYQAKIEALNNKGTKEGENPTI